MVRSSGFPGASSFSLFILRRQVSTSAEAARTVQQRILGLVGFIDHGGQLYRLLSYTSDDRWQGYSRTMQGSLASFRNLTDRRYIDVEPKRVRVVRLDRAMTLEEFDRRYPSTIDLQALAILNGVEEGARLEAGQRVKRVVGGELLATGGIFLPSFLFVLLLNPLVPRLRRSPWTAALLDGVNAGAVAVMSRLPSLTRPRAGPWGIVSVWESLTVPLWSLSALAVLSLWPASMSAWVRV